jgi:LysR family transcriptional activator of nhaA
MVEDDLMQRYGVRRVGRCEGVEEHHVAIGSEKKVGHPLVQRLIAARHAARP